MNAAQILTLIVGGQMTSAVSTQTGSPTVEPGAFQALLTNQIKMDGNQKAALQELVDLLSGLNSEQIAELMSLLGAVVNPAANGQTVSEPLSSSSAGSLGIMQTVDNGTVSATASAGTMGLMQTVKNGTVHPSALKASPLKQLAEEMAAFLKQSGLSLEQAVNRVGRMMEQQGLSADKALVRLIQDVPILQTQAVPEGNPTKVSDANPMMQSSQIRPELLALQQQGEKSENQPQAAVKLQPITNPEQTPIDAGSRSSVGRGQADGNAGQLSGSGVSKQTDAAVATEAAEETGLVSLLPTDGKQTIQGEAVPNESRPTEQAAPVILTRTAGTTSNDPKNVTRDTMTPEQFKTDFSGLIVKQASVLERGGTHEMRITLMPEGLGEVQVRIVEQSGQLTVQLSADTQYARNLLDSGMGMLRQQLESQGLQVNRTEVVSSSSSPFMGHERGMAEEQKHQQQGGNPRNPQRNGFTDSAFQLDEAVYYDQTALVNGQFDRTA
ncbi:flagellar hook-length control protein FliK [Effusibacillus lacus]|uniref:Flagellar hook-length control protein FliK n=1 Tax=Effusibacillus lacus TaxID=1348429 RepID=A0A292YHS3_9BACL|nr:flagellar hook-length control protein FliK [Effusibacillus lacus]TCS73122.1 flagellar hook-length control protein FliK [Effusibacillus lacus]GAX90527.1 flagellar hook-length control protein FliK [Effusibacillus lacus]